VQRGFLLLISILCAFDLLSYYAVGSLLVYQGYLFHRKNCLVSTGIMFVHLMIYGGIASLTPRRELRGKDRHRLMKSQGGHTVMLAYFCGFGVLSEYVRLSRKEGGHLAKFKNAGRLHVYGLSFFKAVMFYFILYQLGDDSQFLTREGLATYIFSGMCLSVCTVVCIALVFAQGDNDIGMKGQ
jgi:hypothetical protein